MLRVDLAPKTTTIGSHEPLNFTELYTATVTFEFPPDTKFGAIHLTNCSCAVLPDSLALGNELSIHTAPVMTLSELDKRRIGQDYAGAFERSNLVLVASRQSDTAGVLDGESLDLERRVYALLYAIFMRGVPDFWPGVYTRGGRCGKENAWANRIALVNDLFRHGDAVPHCVTVDSLHEAALVVQGFMEVFGTHSDFRLLRRGINALVPGWKARSVLDRLHAFVRPLGGLMKLERGVGERQFADRLAVFATATRLHDIALEIYRLRSYEEHLSDWPSQLAYIKEADRSQFVSHRSFQAEVLAGAAYRTLLADEALRREFRDSRVDTFWQAGGESWTAKVDLDVLDARFQYRGEH